MKTNHLYSRAVAIALIAAASVAFAGDPGQSGSSQSPSSADPGQTGSSQSPSAADPGQTGSSQSPSAASGSQSRAANQQNSTLGGTQSAYRNPSSSSSATGQGQEGVIVTRGMVYFIKDGQAQRLDIATFQPGKLMTREGQWQDAPQDAASSTGASAQNQNLNGFVKEDGQLYLLRNGQATRLDANTVPEGKMLTFEGQIIDAPANVPGVDQGATSTGSGIINPSASGSSSSGVGTNGPASSAAGSGTGTSSTNATGAGATSANPNTNPGGASPSATTR